MDALEQNAIKVGLGHNILKFSFRVTLFVEIVEVIEFNVIGIFVFRPCVLVLHLLENRFLGETIFGSDKLFPRDLYTGIFS